MDKNKIETIPSFYIDLDNFKMMNLEKKYDLIFVGRLAKNKGINLFIEAVKLLITNYQLPIKALIIGDGPLRKNYELRITNYGLKDNILFSGWVKGQEEIAKLLNQSRVFILTSLNEGGPRVLLEAMACGVPVLATLVGIVPDIVRSGESGEVIEWNAADIAKKGSDLLHDRDKNQMYVLAGLEIAKQFEKKVAIKNYADKLKKFIKL